MLLIMAQERYKQHITIVFTSSKALYTPPFPASVLHAMLTLCCTGPITWQCTSFKLPPDDAVVHQSTLRTVPCYTQHELVLAVFHLQVASSLCVFIRQGASYERVFNPQPLPAHLLTPTHQAHLTSLAEDSEEGSDAVSESEGGLIQDDDSPTEASPAASASLDHLHGPRAPRSSLIAATGQTAVGTPRAAAGTDGMFELDINDDMEQGSGLNSFTARSSQRLSQHAAVTGAGVQQQKSHTPAAATPQGEQQAAYPSSHAAAVSGSSADGLQFKSSTLGQYEHSSQPYQQQKPSSVPQPLLESAPAAALSATPILGGPDPGGDAHPAGSHPTTMAVGALAGVDLQEIELQDGVADDKAAAGQGATDEWVEVNLARARELAVDAPTAAIPGDKVRRCDHVVLLLTYAVCCRMDGLPLQPCRRKLSG